MKNLNYLIFFLALITIKSMAAPIPATGSSQFSQALRNTLQADDFRLGSFNQDFWELSPQINSISNKLNAWHFQGSGENLTARFSVHIDRVSDSTELKQYVKKWIKEYPYLGFEILATNSMQIDGKPAFVVDLANKAKNKQLRQFVVHNKERNLAVVMTCTDIKSKFLITIDKCHEIIKNFQWAAGPSNKTNSK